MNIGPEVMEAASDFQPGTLRFLLTTVYRHLGALLDIWVADR